MKSGPLLELDFGALALFFGVPAKHGITVLETYFFAVAVNDAVRVVKEIIGVDEGDADFVVGGPIGSVSV